MKILKMVGYVMLYVAVAVIALLITVLISGKHTYTKDGYVYSINGNIITVVDEDGMLWDFYGDEFEEGQEVVIKFDNNGTDYLNDDTIIDVKIS